MLPNETLYMLPSLTDAKAMTHEEAIDAIREAQRILIQTGYPARAYALGVAHLKLSWEPPKAVKKLEFRA